MASQSFVVRDLLGVLNEIAAFSLAESWDNVGLLAGDPAAPVRGILVALDPTEAVVDEALGAGCNVVVTHHPVIFHPLKAVCTDTPVGRLLAKALSAGVALVACHTNLDLVGGGVNDVLAERLGLVETRPLADTPGEEFGFGRIGRLAEPLPGREMLARVARTLGVEAVAFAGPVPETVRSMAVCGGSGSELAETAHRLGAQMYVTAEVKHATARWAEAAGLCVVDGGHFATENVVVPEFVRLLRHAMERGGHELPIRAAAAQRSPFFYCIVS